MASEVPKAELLNDIVNKALSVEDVKKRIRELENKYGNEYFLDYEIEEAGIEKRDKSDWNEEYWDKIRMKGIFGISSKQYFLYFAEVNEYIHNKRLEEKKLKQHKRIIAIASATVIAIICIVICVMCFNGSQTNAVEISGCNQMTYFAETFSQCSCMPWGEDTNGNFI